MRVPIPRRAASSSGARSALRLAFIACLGATLVAPGCKRDSFEVGQLTSPERAREWRQGLEVAFDDRYTATPVRMEGRASHDVLDQRLFAARLGHSDLVIRMVVEEVWSRGRFKGHAQQYVDARFDTLLLGKVPPRTSRHQRIKVSAADDLPSDLPGADLLLFVRWAPGETPSYHHHMMPVTDEILLLIDAMVADAQANGVVFDGEAANARKRRRRARKQAKDQSAPPQSDPG